MTTHGYQPLDLPIQDYAPRTVSGDLNTFFAIWDGVLKANLGVTNQAGSFSGTTMADLRT